MDVGSSVSLPSDSVSLLQIFVLVLHNCFPIVGAKSGFQAWDNSLIGKVLSRQV